MNLRRQAAITRRLSTHSSPKHTVAQVASACSRAVRCALCAVCAAAARRSPLACCRPAACLRTVGTNSVRIPHASDWQRDRRRRRRRTRLSIIARNALLCSATQCLSAAAAAKEICTGPALSLSTSKWAAAGTAAAVAAAAAADASDSLVVTMAGTVQRRPASRHQILCTVSRKTAFHLRHTPLSSPFFPFMSFSHGQRRAVAAAFVCHAPPPSTGHLL